MFRAIHVEVPNNVPVDTASINSALSGLVIQAEDSHDLEDILNEAILSFYRTMPHGKRNYGKENGRLGWVYIHRGLSKGGYADMEFVPSASYREECRYGQARLGTLNLRERTYSVRWDGNYDKKQSHIPKAVMKDTERVMECLGFKKIEEPLSF